LESSALAAPSAFAASALPGESNRQVMDDAARQRLVSNVVGHLRNGVSKEVLDRVFEYWKNVDHELGRDQLFAAPTCGRDGSRGCRACESRRTTQNLRVRADQSVPPLA